MSSSHFNVLYIDHLNSVRSIMAEALLNHKSGPNVTAYSAGNQPGEAVHPIVIEQLVQAGISTDGLRSKPWNEFTAPGAPVMQCVVTLWDDPVRPDHLPSWPGSPATANWGVSDPLYLTSIAVPPREIDRAFTGAFTLIERRIERLLALPLASIEPSNLQQEHNRIGHL